MRKLHRLSSVDSIEGLLNPLERFERFEGKYYSLQLNGNEIASGSDQTVTTAQQFMENLDHLAEDQPLASEVMAMKIRKWEAEQKSHQIKELAAHALLPHRLPRGSHCAACP